MSISHTKITQQYWSNQAEGYSSIHNKGLRAWLRKKEICANIFLLDLKSSEFVLDAGCGSGITTKILLGDDRKVVGVDFADAMILEAKKNGLSAYVEDISVMDLKQRFDKILSAGVFEYLDEPEKALLNLKKHLNPSGTIVLSAPRKNFAGYGYKTMHYLKGINVVLYSKADFSRLLLRCGFKLINFKKTLLSIHVSARQAK
ncbi:MAG: hypothetical protein A3J73_06045 [Planctomycetes bacterium RIFCSPHIGHO2_02_FULL_38_41]|nr:MAG: hypothetical protein A3J73_06045 [Planctomycetes bacterium RIFCSPHIGHO2_02_FULL_38_41]